MEELTEHEIYMLIAHYLTAYYPNTIYRFDLAADMKLTPGQARRHKLLHPRRGYPDLFIAKPKTVRKMSGESRYHGLFLEIKKAGTRMKKKDGSWASLHLEEQAWMLEKLREAGYRAEFAVGLDEAYRIIDEYMED